MASLREITGDAKALVGADRERAACVRAAHEFFGWLSLGLRQLRPQLRLRYFLQCGARELVEHAHLSRRLETCEGFRACRDNAFGQGRICDRLAARTRRAPRRA